VVEQAFEYLQAPIVRVTGRNSPNPFSDSIVNGVWQDPEDVVRAIRKTME
jgi:pyruvate/2-oxoglutarate/acetoin dehydrogenase E1 component